MPISLPFHSIRTNVFQDKACCNYHYLDRRNINKRLHSCKHLPKYTNSLQLSLNPCRNSLTILRYAPISLISLQKPYPHPSVYFPMNTLNFDHNQSSKLVAQQLNYNLKLIPQSPNSIMTREKEPDSTWPGYNIILTKGLAKLGTQDKPRAEERVSD